MEEKTGKLVLRLEMTKDELDELFHKVFLMTMSPPDKNTGRYYLELEENTENFYNKTKRV